MKFSLFKYLAAALFISVLVSCSDDDNEKDAASTNSDRFTSVTVDEEITISDAETGLQWVNGLTEDSMKAETGCHPLPSGIAIDDVRVEANNFCETLDFSSHTDWRVPLVDEIYNYTLALYNADITPFYQNPSCPRVIGFEEGVVTGVKTVNTHNTNPVAEINDWAAKNVGVRCTRESN